MQPSNRRRSGSGHGRSKGKSAAESFKGVHAPYNFTPLPRRFVPPGWRKNTSIDVPFEDGVCGELEIKLTNHTPLLIGGEREKDGTVPFHQVGDDYVIPGSSIRGMIRNLAEIVSFAKLPQVNNQYPTLRDVRDTAYKNMLTGAGNNLIVKAGWLRFSADTNQYQIIPCHYARIAYRDIEQATGAQQLKGEKTLTGKYKKVGGLGKVIDFRLNGKNTVGENKATAGNGQKGHLVLTGWGFNKAKEYVFFDNQKPESVSPEIMQAFNTIYRKQGDKAPLTELEILLKNNRNNAPGIPVFFTRNNTNAIEYLGLTLMMKIPPQHSVEDLHPASDLEHLPVDIVENLFGRIDETPHDQIKEQYRENHYSLKSRVSFADLKASANAQEVEEEIRVILGQPSASFYPAYLNQSKNNLEGRLTRRMLSYHDQQQAELRGFKRYPIQHGAPNQHPMPSMEEKVKENDKVKTGLKPLREGATFTGKIRFHNLKPKELGLLLWCLTWGGDENNAYFHNLGMAKPYGYGCAKVKVTKVSVEHNNLERKEGDIVQQSWDQVSDSMNNLMAEFAAMMEKCANQLNNGEGWIEGPIMTELLAMANGVTFDQQHLQYLPLRHHTLAKANDSNSNRINGYALKAFSAWLGDGKKLS